MAKIVIKDVIRYKGEQTIPDGVEDFKRKLAAGGNAKHNAFKGAITALLANTDFERIHPPTYGFEEEIDPEE